MSADPAPCSPWRKTQQAVRAGIGWRIVNAETMRPVRRSIFRQAHTAYRGLYDIINATPSLRFNGPDFLAVDLAGNPIPASRLRRLMEEEMKP